MRIFGETASSPIHVPDCRDVVLAVLKVDGELLEHVDERWCKDEQVVLTAVKQCGRALRFVRHMSMLNHEIVWKRLSRNGNKT